jgi:ABC-type lipoprotein release transport system permease subunit
MSILERTREFGLLQALGMEKGRIRRLISAEAFVLGLIGSAGGFAAGSAASFYTWYYGIDMSAMFDSQEVAGQLFEPIITSTWCWGWMFGLSAIMVILVLAASIYPAAKALRVNPADAMRAF